jgi:hypothetical protein
VSGNEHRRRRRIETAKTAVLDADSDAAAQHTALRAAQLTDLLINQRVSAGGTLLLHEDLHHLTERCEECGVDLKPTRRLRVVTILVVMAVWFGIAVALNSNGLTTLYASLSLALYLLLPWTAVNLMDYFFVRRGQYHIQDLFCATGIYGAWGWRGISAYGIGFLASVPFFVLTGYYEGPIAKAIGGVDISWARGLLISAFSY